MKKRAAIELSMNFLVIIIISIVIFGFGIVFISRLTSEATSLKEITSNELDEKISSLSCESSERICIGEDRKTIEKGAFGLFGLKIINVLDTNDFTVTVAQANPKGYMRNNDPILTGSPDLTVNPSEREVTIETNDEMTIGIGVEVPKDAVSGTYIFNIDIKDEDGNPYSSVLKIYVDVP